MDEQILEALRKKALGYTYDEIQEEYSVNEDGDSILTKKKIVKKYCPPDSVALKAYLELAPEKSYDKMSDEELETEKQRLLLELKEKTDKNKTNNQQDNQKSVVQKQNSVSEKEYQQIYFFGEEENNLTNKD